MTNIFKYGWLVVFSILLTARSFRDGFKYEFIFKLFY